MAAFTTAQYFSARVPEITTLIPSFNTDMAVNAAWAFYWHMLFPSNPPSMGDAALTERQKVMCSLKAAISVFLTMVKSHEAKVTYAKGGPAETKFEERFKTFQLTLDAWKQELALLESAEGIFWDVLQPIPPCLVEIESFTTVGLDLE